MCAWNTTFPDGSKSVKSNKTIGQQNTTYTKTTLNVDHQWHVGTDEDGHHKFAQMAGYETGGTPDDPTLATGMDLVYFAKLKTAAEAVAQQDVQPFARVSTNIMQLLGIRAMALFDVSGGVATLKYGHNIASVAWQATGRFLITYTNALPSINYLVLGGAIKNTGATSYETLIAGVSGGVSVLSVKNTANCLCVTKDTSGAANEPTQAWFVMFGG